MRYFSIFVLLAFAVLFVPGQNEVTSESTPTPTPQLTDEQVLENAKSISDVSERMAALEAFLEEYPESEYRLVASEYLTSSRAAVADKLVEAGKADEGVALFRKAVSEAPRPVPEQLFRQVLINIPKTLYVRGQAKAALEIADQLESMSEGDSGRLVRLAAFHIAIKYSTGARRVAEKAIVADPQSAPAYKVLADAARIGFDLQTALESYEKALTFDAENKVLLQNIAEMQRATGDSESALEIYRDLLEKEPENIVARTGEILCLLDIGRREEGQKKLIEEVSSNVTNAFAMTGAANWFVAHGEPDLAIDFANQALILDESSAWPYIILGRAHTLKNEPDKAESVLMRGSRFSGLPTLRLELALAHLRAGSYRSAIVVVRSAFSLEDGKIVTNLDQRVGVEAETFSRSVVLERKSFLFSDDDGVTEKEDATLKNLFVFDSLLRDDSSTPEALRESASQFIGDPDSMRGFRRLFVADVLLERNREQDFAASMAQGAVEDASSSLSSGNAVSAVMSDALFPRRIEAAENGSVILPPKVESAVVDRIYRGKVELISGRSAFALEDFDTAETHIKRAVSVLPKDSVWWKSGKWLLGLTLEKKGDDTAALSELSESYRSGYRPTEVRDYISGVFERVYGSTEGLDEFLNSQPTKEENSIKASFLKDSPKPPDSTVVGNDETTNTEIKEPETKKPSELRRPVLSEDLILDFKKLPGTENAPIPVSVERDTKESETPKTDEDVSKKPDVNADAPKPNPVGDLKQDVDPQAEKPKSSTESNSVDAGNERKDVGTEKQALNESVKKEEPKTEPDVSTDPGENQKTVSDGASKEGSVADPNVSGSETKTNIAGESTESLFAEVSIPRTGAILSGAERVRIVPPDQVRDASGVPVKEGCKLVFSQESVSVFTNGGSFGIVAGLEGFDDAYVLRARSLNPADVSVRHEPGIGSIEGRAFFVLSSISDRTGSFLIEFESPCGKKSVEVSVYK